MRPDMKQARRKPVYWKRQHPPASFDIAKLRPQTLPRGERFETLHDACEESARSQAILAGNRWSRTYFGSYLRDCCEGHYDCGKTYCPVCARTFRRYFTGELLRLNAEFSGKVRIFVVLLEKAPKEKLGQLQIERL